HWRLFFLLSDGNSVEFNSQQLQSGNKMTRLYITYRTYHFSTRSAVRGNIYTNIQGHVTVTVGNIIQLLVHQKLRDRYQLNPLGSGCRFWCQTAIADLEQASYIAPGSAATIEANLQQLNRRYGKTWVPYPLIQGTFY
ncbi:hypothetical protein B0H14DRAFT_2407449, partial [Mycena olivaceomarginata]